jgi:hypothetical protein
MDAGTITERTRRLFKPQGTLGNKGKYLPSSPQGGLKKAIEDGKNSLSLRERVTTAWMQEVEQRMEQLPRMRGTNKKFAKETGYLCISTPLV